MSNLFTGGTNSLSLISEIEKDIESANKIRIIVSFLRLSGVNLIYDSLKKFTADNSHKLEIITTTYCGITEPKAIERLAELPNTEIRIAYDTNRERLHAKAYIFSRESGYDTAYIGSSNLSKSAQTDGLEWNIRVTNVENPHIIEATNATFERYWHSKDFEDFKIGGIEKFREQLKIVKQHKNSDSTFLHPFQILPHQLAVLNRLDVERDNSNFRNLVVAATGTGKTVMSAFDFKRYKIDNPNCRLLFVAHREEILRQSLSTYRCVLQDHNFGALWVGQYKPENGIDNLFISVQTFNSRYEETFKVLNDDYYDFIVIDEAHHITADTYRRILNKFKPKILLGLTATPERMDGQSLLPDFGGHISAEIRLPKALQEGLLTPFQYYCISDETDLSESSMMIGNKYITSKIIDKLCNKQRVSLILNKLNYYINDETKCKALCFCASKEHAKYMSEAFNDVGLKSDYLLSDNADSRKTLSNKLRSGDINYLFVVDIFNEGVDIPEVDTVLFLRPTESITIFLQQLGRGLRLSENKSVLTVLDFVSQYNSQYDYASRFRHLMTKPDKNLKQQIENGFVYLPPGCSIHMEEVAQKRVLDSINAAIYNKTRLEQTLRSMTYTPTLSQFIEEIGQDVRLIYRNNCWSSLKRAAGKCDYKDDELTKRFSKGISSIVHINSIKYLNRIEELAKGYYSIPPADSDLAKFDLALYYALFQEKISKLGYKDIYEALAKLKEYPVFTDEILQLIAYVRTTIDIKTKSIGNSIPDCLELYGVYSREETFIMLGVQTENHQMRGSISGVHRIPELNTEVFFVTLNKSDKDFSPSTQYDDYIISENRFHWQSQNTDSHKNNGRRFVDQKSNGKKFILMVRESKTDGYGNTMPFCCFGLVDYISSRGDFPMNIEWEVKKPIPSKYIEVS